MVTPDDAATGSLDDDYEEYTEFQCPVCKTPVEDDDSSCPGCGAIFVADGGDSGEMSLDDAELEMDYQLDEDADYDDLDSEELEAEIAAMEADLSTGPATDDLLLDDSDAELFDLDLAYEEELSEDDEVEEAFGGAVKVTADDASALDELSQPNILERTFARMGFGMFVAGGIATVLIVLWDPLHGSTISLGMTQWRFMVLAMAMFIVGFAIEMVQAYSLSHDDDRILRELLEG